MSEIKPQKNSLKPKDIQDVLEDLNFDQELKSFVSAITTVPEHTFIQEQGACFLGNSINGNYNAINIGGMLADYWHKKDSKLLMEKIIGLLQEKEQLLQNMQCMVQEEFDQKRFSFLTIDDELLEHIQIFLIQQQLLAKYYADLALFRIILVVQASQELPKHLFSLAPRHFLELMESLRWPPMDENTQKRAAMVDYKLSEKGLYVIHRLVNHNPIEFDMKKKQFINKWE